MFIIIIIIIIIILLSAEYFITEKKTLLWSPTSFFCNISKLFDYYYVCKHFTVLYSFLF